jgi:hypothetical protein
MNARRARQRLADHLVALIVGRIGPPRSIVAWSKNGDHGCADGRRNVDDATIVGNHQSTAPDKRAQSLWTRRRRRDSRGGSDVFGYPPGQHLLVRVEPTQHDRHQAMPFQQRPPDS